LLIVAIPKSASSSLAASLAKATRWPRQNADIRKRFLTPAPAPDGYTQLKRFHSEVADLTPEAAQLLALPGQITKLHVVPTANNLALLRDMPKVVLLRPAEEIVAAYWRGLETSTWTTLVGDIARCSTQDQWMGLAEQIGLTDELRRFNHDWQLFDGDALVISYADLTRQPEATIRAVMEYFGIDTACVPELAQVNYSRDGGSGTPAHRRMYFALKRVWARFAGS
jgi:hypothetical protein